MRIGCGGRFYGFAAQDRGRDDGAAGNPTGVGLAWYPPVPCVPTHQGGGANPKGDRKVGLHGSIVSEPKIHRVRSWRFAAVFRGFFSRFRSAPRNAEAPPAPRTPPGANRMFAGLREGKSDRELRTAGRSARASYHFPGRRFRVSVVTKSSRELKILSPCGRERLDAKHRAR